MTQRIQRHKRGPLPHRKKLAQCTHSLALTAILFGVTLELWITFTTPIPEIRDRLHNDEDRAFLELQRRKKTIRKQLQAERRREGRNPRVVYYRSADNSLHARSDPSFQLIPSTTRIVDTMSDSCLYCEHDPSNHMWPFERDYYNVCTPMEDWQTTFYPVCNSLHELSLVDHTDEHVISLLSMQGSWRSVWKVTGSANETNNVEPTEIRNQTNARPQAVLKLLKFSNREFDHESFRYHQTDAMAMERLTGSRHVVDAYGFCGQSVLTEFTPVSARERVKDKLSSIERLWMGRELARALADVHSIDHRSGKNATLAHNDLNMANVVVSHNGRLKLNDFNIGVLMRWNGARPCGYPSRFHNPLWKSPEEIRNTTYVDPSRSDVYSLGSILFQVMTKHQPWTHLEPGGALDKEVVAQRKLEGRLPTIPDKYIETIKPATQALLFSVLSCYRSDPKDRLTALELARAMDTVLLWLRDGKKASRMDVMGLFIKGKRKGHNRTSIK